MSGLDFLAKACLSFPTPTQSRHDESNQYFGMAFWENAGMFHLRCSHARTLIPHTGYMAIYGRLFLSIYGSLRPVTSYIHVLECQKRRAYPGMTTIPTRRVEYEQYDTRDLSRFNHNDLLGMHGQYGAWDMRCDWQEHIWDYSCFGNYYRE